MLQSIVEEVAGLATNGFINFTGVFGGSALHIGWETQCQKRVASKVAVLHISKLQEVPIR
jgi:hypothetical protein